MMMTSSTGRLSHARMASQQTTTSSVLRPATKCEVRAMVKQVTAKRRSGNKEVSLVAELEAAGLKLDHLAMPTPGEALSSRASRQPRESENSVIDHAP